MVLEFFQDASYDKKIFLCYEIFSDHRGCSIEASLLEGKIRLRHAHVRLQHFQLETYKSATIGFPPLKISKILENLILHLWIF